MNIQLSDEAVEEIFHQYMLEDYRVITDNVKELKDTDKHFGLSHWEATDLQDYKKNRKALKVVLKYYLGENWKENL